MCYVIYWETWSKLEQIQIARPLYARELRGHFYNKILAPHKKSYKFCDRHAYRYSVKVKIDNKVGEDLKEYHYIFAPLFARGRTREAVKNTPVPHY